jgi:hypothetical protein
LKSLRGNTSLDTSALIEYLTGTKEGEAIKEYFKTLKPEETANCSILTVSEMLYILCRLKGATFAQDKISDMLKSQAIQVYNTTDLAIQTGKIKCERAISLADCSCIATAKLANAKAVFARKEKELAREMKRKPFDVEITFLEK